MVLLAYTPHPERDPQLGRLWKGGISVAQNKLLSPLSLGPKPGRGLRPHWAGALGPPGGGSAVLGTDSQDGESLHLGRMFSWFRKHPLDATVASPRSQETQSPPPGGSPGWWPCQWGSGCWGAGRPRAALGWTPGPSWVPTAAALSRPSRGGGRAGTWARAGAGPVTS